jgi:pyruvate formate lyase activating enzyme
MSGMKFSGLQKTSLVDFPDRVASVLFTPGCNLRCPFCHNWRIVVDPRPPFLTEETALRILENRRKYVDSVVVTGGEPTIHKELPKFLKRLKERGFTLKLDTNGLDFRRLEECLLYVDYVALDVKTSLEKYPRLGTGDTAELLRTVEVLKTGKVEYEFRTTVVPGLVELEDVYRICDIVKGTKTFAFQQFVPGDTLSTEFRTLMPYSKEIISGYADVMKRHAEEVVLRV